VTARAHDEADEAFDAPYLVAKLVDLKIAADDADASLLVREAMRLLDLRHADPRLVRVAPSRLVHEAWRQLVLFTREYADVCARRFGAYVHYDPERYAGATLACTDAAFLRAYEARFGPLPDVWFDERAITPNRRVARAVPVGFVRVAGPDVLPEALAFLAETEAFYVRELPATDDEARVALCRRLVGDGVLRIAP
jgi:hypothetical protein